jgi:uncharacterized ParB-like nuclease family protein
MMRRLMLCVVMCLAGCRAAEPRLPSDPVRLTVVEETSKPVPGLRGEARLHLGKVEGGQALLSVRGPDGSAIVAVRSVEPEDAVPFEVRGKRYYLSVIELRGYLTDAFGVFEVSTRPPGAWTLTLPEDPVRLTILQRRSRTLPGSGDKVAVHIGDITGGQTLLWIGGPKDEPILRRQSVKPGDVLPFRVRGKLFYFHVVKFRTFLTSDDYGIFEVSTTRPEPPPEDSPKEAP